ncbi:MAG: MATE family efflux transporter [Phycisphaerales bacterium]|nr:MATE family efflux transporter [Phycisphaerales bacterium]
MPAPASAPPSNPDAPRPLTPPGLPPGSLARQIRILALPMLGEQLGNFLIGLVDTLLAGQISREATGAVGTAAYVGWFTGLLFMLVSTGAAALVSRSFGAGDPRAASRVLNQSVLLMLLMGVLAAAGVWSIAPTIAGFLTGTSQASAMFVLYLRIDAFGYLLGAVLAIVNTALRAAGDTRTPMVVMLGVNVVNAVVSMTLVFGWLGPPMGVAGIATGTVAARCLGGLAALTIAIVGWRSMRLTRADLRPDPGYIWRILRIGIPGAAEAAVLTVAQFLFIKVVSMTAPEPLGGANYAAHMIAVRLEAITYLPAMAWMTAAATMVGQYLGAQLPRQAARAAHVAALQGGVLAALIAVNFYVWADFLFGVMSNDPLVRQVGAPAFRLLAFVQPILCMGIIYNGALRGAGDTRYTMFTSLVSGLLVRVPGAYLGGIVLEGGLVGAWCGMWADNIVRFALGLARHLHGGWKRVRV